MVNFIEPASIISPIEGHTGNLNPHKMTAKAILQCRANSHPFPDRTLMLDQPVKIGRSVARVRASTSNAVFDCRVLSRNHAALWYDDGKFFLQDTKSSNGTFVNNQRLSNGSEESLPREVSSCDIVQFGVDVQNENKKVTHGCIVATLKLYLPDGEEAKASSSISLSGKASTISPQELYQLQSFLQEAGYREQLVQKKLQALQELLNTTREAVEKSWNKMLDEDTMLQRFEILEAKLATYAKTYQDDEIKQEMINLREDKAQYEANSKQKIQDILNDKLQAISSSFEIGRTCDFANQELEHMTKIAQAAQKKEEQLFEKLTAQSKEIESLTQKLHAGEDKLKKESCKEPEDNHQREVISENSKLIAKIESLKADNDITKEQLNAIKSKYENLKNSATIKSLLESNSDEFALTEAEVSTSYQTLCEAVKSFQDWFRQAQSEICHSEATITQLKCEITPAEENEKKLCTLKETIKEEQLRPRIAEESNKSLKKELLQQMKQFDSELTAITSNSTNYEDFKDTLVRKKKNKNTEVCEDAKDKENNEMIIRDKSHEDSSSTNTTLANYGTVCLNGRESPNENPFKDIASYIKFKIRSLQETVTACDKCQTESGTDLAKYTLDWETANTEATTMRSQLTKSEHLLMVQSQHIKSLQEIKDKLEASLDAVHAHLCCLTNRLTKQKTDLSNARHDTGNANKQLQDAESASQAVIAEAESLRAQLQQLQHENDERLAIDCEKTPEIPTNQHLEKDLEKDLEIEQLQGQLVTITEAYQDLKTRDTPQPEQQSFNSAKEDEATIEELKQELQTLLDDHKKLKLQLTARDDDLSDLCLQNQIVVPTWALFIAIIALGIGWNGISLMF